MASFDPELVKALIGATSPAKPAASLAQGFQAGMEQQHQAKLEEFKKKLELANIVPGPYAQGIAKKAGWDVQPADFAEGATPSMLSALVGQQKDSSGDYMSEDTLRLIQYPAYVEGQKRSGQPYISQDAYVKAMSKVKQGLVMQPTQFGGRLSGQEVAMTQPERAALGRAQGVSFAGSQEAQEKNDMAQIAIDQLEGAAGLLGDFNPGVAEQIVSQIGLSWDILGKQPPQTIAMAIIEQQINQLARGPFANTGVLTKEDIENVKRGLGDPTTPILVKNQILSGLRAKTLGVTMKAYDRAARIAVNPETKSLFKEMKQELVPDFNRYLAESGLKTYQDSMSTLVKTAKKRSTSTKSSNPKLDELNSRIDQLSQQLEAAEQRGQ